jgi:cell division protein FtsB
MLDYKEKNKARRFMYSTPVLVFLAFFLLFLLSKTWVLYKTSEDARRKADEAKMELRKLEERKTDLAASVNFLKTERGKESKIREKFMVGKEGEGVILLVDQPPATNTESIPRKSSFWSGFLNFFR